MLLGTCSKPLSVCFWTVAQAAACSLQAAAQALPSRGSVLFPGGTNREPKMNTCLTELIENQAKCAALNWWRTSETEGQSTPQVASSAVCSTASRNPQLFIESESHHVILYLSFKVNWAQGPSLLSRRTGIRYANGTGRDKWFQVLTWWCWCWGKFKGRFSSVRKP